MITAPDGAMLNQKFFVSRLDNPFPDLYERFWDGVEWIWVNHGRPDGVRMKTAPGAAMLDEKVFVVTDDGNLRERHWRADLSQWVWEDHGRPGNQRITQAPGAAMLGENSSSSPKPATSGNATGAPTSNAGPGKTTVNRPAPGPPPRRVRR